MKVVIKSEKTNLFIILPTSLILNRLSATIAIKIIKSKQPSIDISGYDFKKFINSIKNYKRQHKRWEVVNISSADGEIVFVSL